MITLNIDGVFGASATGSPTATAVFGGVSPDGDFSVVATASVSDFAIGSTVFTSVINLTNLTGATETIEIDALGAGLMFPTGDVALSTTLTGAVPIVGMIISASDYGAIDGSDTTPIKIANVAATTSQSAFSTPIGVSGVTAPVSLNNYLSVTLAGGTTAQLTASTTATPTPEPSRVVGLLGLALVGGMGLCFGRMRNRMPAVC